MEEIAVPFIINTLVNELRFMHIYANALTLGVVMQSAHIVWVRCYSKYCFVSTHILFSRKETEQSKRETYRLTYN